MLSLDAFKTHSFILLLGLAQTGLAVTISGRLIDRGSHEPIFRAEVYVADTAIKMKTSDLGIFVIQMENEYIGQEISLLFARYRYESRLLRFQLTSKSLFVGTIEMEMYERQPDFFLLPSLTITGQVTDESGKPLADVEILVSNTTGHSFSNHDGEFRLQVDQIREIGETEVVLYKKGHRTKLLTIQDLKSKNYLIRFEQVISMPATRPPGEQYMPAIQTFSAPEIRNRKSKSTDVVPLDSSLTFSHDPLYPIQESSFFGSGRDSLRHRANTDSSAARSIRQFIALRFRDDEVKSNFLRGVRVMSSDSIQVKHVSDESGYLALSDNEFFNLPDTIMIVMDGYVAVNILKKTARNNPVINLRPEIQLVFVDSTQLTRPIQVKDVELQILGRNRPRFSLTSSEAGIIRLDSALLPARCVAVKEGYQKRRFDLPHKISKSKKLAQQGLAVKSNREVVVNLIRLSKP